MQRDVVETVYTADAKPFAQGTAAVERRLARLDRTTSDRLDRIDQRWARAQRAVNGVRTSIGALAAGAGLVTFGRLALRVGRDFEAALNRIKAASGASAGEIDQLANAARRLGRETSFSASDAAAGIETLVRNGVSVSDILGGALDASLRLAEATGGDLASAADLATDVMGQFNLEAGELARVVDLVSGGVVNSKFGFDGFTGAIAQSGSVAATAGVEFDEYIAAIAGTAQAFKSGSDAGTSFKTFITSLTGNSDVAKAKIKALGLEFFDASGNLRPMREISQELQDALGSLSEEARTADLKTIFGNDALRTAAELTKQGAEGFDRLSAAIGGVSAADQAASRMEGLEGSTKRAAAAFEGLLLAIGEQGGLSAATEATDAFAFAMNALTDNLGLVAGSVAALAGGRGIGALVSALQSERAARQVLATQREADLRRSASALQAAKIEQASRVLSLRTLQTEGATKARIAGATRALETANVRAAAATQAHATAVGALAVATSRLTIAATIAHRVMTGLRGVMAFFGGPIGLAITALAVGVVALGTSGDDAARSIEGLRGRFADLATETQKVSALDRELARDKDLLQRKSAALKSAISAQGEAAVATARIEIDQINGRIAANEKLRAEYARVLRASLAIANQDLATRRREFRNEVSEGAGGVTGFISRNAAEIDALGGGLQNPEVQALFERDIERVSNARLAAIAAAQDAGEALDAADLKFLNDRAGISEVTIAADKATAALERLDEAAEKATKPAVTGGSGGGASSPSAGGSGGGSRSRERNGEGRDRIAELVREREAIGKVGLELALLEERERALSSVRSSGRRVTAQQLRQADQQALTAALLRTEIDEMRKAEQILAAAKRDGLSVDQQRAALAAELEQLRPRLIQLAGSEAAAQDAITAAIERSNKALGEQENLGKRVADTLVDGFGDILKNVDDAGDALKRLGFQLASLLLRQVAQPAIEAAIGGLFMSGGWTGDGARNEIAGQVHGQEFVVKAPYAARYRQALEALNSGGGLAGFSTAMPTLAMSAPSVPKPVSGGASVAFYSETNISIQGDAARDPDAVLAALRPELDQRDRRVVERSVRAVQRGDQNDPNFLRR